VSWHLHGNSYACCSCSVGCPCAAGGLETAGSDGCCAVQIMDIASGEIAGVDVAGTKVAAVVDWPGAMMSGNGTGRLYFDADTTPVQRDALETLISGSLGGTFSRMPDLVPKVLPSIVAPIRKERRNDGTTIVVGTFGEAIVKPMVGSAGESMLLRGVGGFRDEVVLATGNGSWWRDPDLRQWEGGGYAEQSDIDWRG
jgi:hypothetical protein